jgi:ligand-binding SRPBCC domain-containing protein
MDSPDLDPSKLAGFLAADETSPREVTVLHREMIVRTSLDRTFAFFADAANLELLTPSWLNFTIRTPMPVVMRQGAEIEYRIRLYGVPIPWRSRIVAWEPGVRFVDRQLAGPYRWWEHEHQFHEIAGGTRVIDRVEYLPRAAWLVGAFVRRDLERIFSFRQRALARVLG